ncbi:MAG: HAD hydrolase family protein [Nitrospirae bacterium]|nr:HAD hydrolase family protein [Nitrospirota bacterium]
MEVPLEIVDRCLRVNALILDVDGVLTDGSIVIDAQGKELKTFNVRDGQGVKMLQRAGVIVCIISGRASKAVERRAAELKILDLFAGCEHKGWAYEQFKAKHQLVDDEIACMGDDIADLVMLKRAGLAITVADGDELTRKHCHYVTVRPGGRGAVREVCEIILKAKGLLDQIVDEYAKV